ncbi:GNAT family N-acetyltransferase [Cohnella candidum]|uniref:GNAT family N-acetyltransferase n=1 Tax=Cohnella candidum TaxID=2674991 RepID=A0A3G3JZE7_9BACL|nr:GNAT family N-acetyltransferase [Cohnella candidum]AYQ73636.1 GNAT family N-acetyltransferase [Cohnella candidum]
MIRWRRSGDEAAIVELVRTELVPLSRRPGMKGSRIREEIAERMRRGVTLVAAGSNRGEPIAFLHMEVRNETLFVDLLAVKASEQNRRWGSQLMEKGELYGISMGCKEVRLFVDDTNARGLRFYGKRGYYTVRHIPSAYCYELGKPLAAWRPPFGNDLSFFEEWNFKVGE